MTYTIFTNKELQTKQAEFIATTNSWSNEFANILINDAEQFLKGNTDWARDLIVDIKSPTIKNDAKCFFYLITGKKLNKKNNFRFTCTEDKTTPEQARANLDKVIQAGIDGFYGVRQAIKDQQRAARQAVKDAKEAAKDAKEAAKDDNEKDWIELKEDIQSAIEAAIVSGEFTTDQILDLVNNIVNES